MSCPLYVLSGGLCVSPTLIFVRVTLKDYFANSHANWQQIDVLSCVKTVWLKWTIEDLSPLWRICISVCRALSLAFKKASESIWQEAKTAHPPWGEIPLSGRERKKKGQSEKYKKRHSYYFKLVVLQQLSLALGLCFLAVSWSATSLSAQVFNLLPVRISCSELTCSEEMRNKS